MTQGELREVRELEKGCGRGPCERERGDRSRTVAAKGRGNEVAARCLWTPAAGLRCGVEVRQGRWRALHPFERELPRDVQIGAWAWRRTAVEKSGPAQANQSVSQLPRCRRHSPITPLLTASIRLSCCLSVLTLLQERGCHGDVAGKGCAGCGLGDGQWRGARRRQRRRMRLRHLLLLLLHSLHSPLLSHDLHTGGDKQAVQ